MSASMPPVELARRVADHLESIGDRKRAEDVRKLVRSNAALRRTVQSLQRETDKLRRRSVTTIARTLAAEQLQK